MNLLDGLPGLKVKYSLASFDTLRVEHRPQELFARRTVVFIANGISIGTIRGIHSLWKWLAAEKKSQGSVLLKLGSSEGKLREYIKQI